MEDTPKTFGARVAAARNARGLTQKELADLAGLSQQAIGAIETEKTKSTGKVFDLAIALNVWPRWLQVGDGEMFAPEEMRLPPIGKMDSTTSVYDLMSPNHLGSANETLPLIGTAAGGEDGLVDWNGEQIDHIPRPFFLVGVPNAYALLVTGDSMFPRYSNGEVIFVNPMRPVTPGSFVVAQLAPEEEGARRGLVKQFVRRTAAETVFRQFNPSKDLKFPTGLVRAMHRIVGSGEL